MRPTFDRRLWILLFWYIIIVQCIQTSNQQRTSSTSLVGQNVRASVDKEDESSSSATGSTVRSLYSKKYSPLCANCNLRLFPLLAAVSDDNNDDDDDDDGDEEFNGIDLTTKSIILKPTTGSDVADDVGHSHLEQHEKHSQQLSSENTEQQHKVEHRKQQQELEQQQQNDQQTVQNHKNYKNPSHNQKHSTTSSDHLIIMNLPGSHENNEKHSLLLLSSDEKQQLQQVGDVGLSSYVDDNSNHPQQTANPSTYMAAAFAAEPRTTTIQTVQSQLPSTNSVNQPEYLLVENNISKDQIRVSDITSPIPPDNSLLRPPYDFKNLTKLGNSNNRIRILANVNRQRQFDDNLMVDRVEGTTKSIANIKPMKFDDDVDENRRIGGVVTPKSVSSLEIDEKSSTMKTAQNIFHKFMATSILDGNRKASISDSSSDYYYHRDANKNSIDRFAQQQILKKHHLRRIAKRNIGKFPVEISPIILLNNNNENNENNNNNNNNNGSKVADTNSGDIGDENLKNDDNENNAGHRLNSGGGEEQKETLFSSSDIRKSDIRYNKPVKQPQKLSFSSLTSSSSSLSSSSLTSVSSFTTITTTTSKVAASSESPDSKTSQQKFINSKLINSPALSSSSSLSSLNDNDNVQSSSPLPQLTDVSNFSFSKLNISHKKITKNINNKLEQNLILNNHNNNNNNNKKHSNGNGKRKQIREPVIIIDEAGEEFDSGLSSGTGDIPDNNNNNNNNNNNKNLNDDYQHDEPLALPLRPIIRGPYDEIDDDEMSIVYAEQHSEIKLMCEVDLDISSSEWFKNRQPVSAVDRSARVTDYRFIKEPNGGLTINNVMLEDDGKWQCKAENSNGYSVNARPVKLIVLDRPKSPYLLIDSRRLDAGNIFVPVKENSELSLACISEGGNPKPTLTWEVLLSPGVDRHPQKAGAEVLELAEIKNDKDKDPYKINSGAKSEARLPAVYRAHHNARILCVMEHPTLKIRQNASLLLDVQYTPSFAISRTPGFGYPLREGIEVSLKCDVDSNPPSTPRWQKDDGDTPVPQTGDGFLNFTSIRREHSGWYKCTSRHLNFQYSSIGYYLSVRYDSVDVTSEPDDQEVSVAAASHNPNKGQLEVQLGGAVTLQCPQGSLGCWSHLDPVTARLRGLGHGLSSPTGQFSLKDVVYQDAGTYKCIGQSISNKKKLEVLQTVGVTVKGAPSAVAKNSTPVAYPGSPLHLSVEFCANPAAHAARWLHGDRVYTPGNQYGSTVLAYGVTDLPTPFCKEARLTYVSMHERVPRTFYFIVSSPGGVAEAQFKVNFTMRYRTMSNSIDDEEEELAEPEEIHFPVFGSAADCFKNIYDHTNLSIFHIIMLQLCNIYIFQ